MNILSFILCAYGMTQILVYGKIFDKIRPTKGWFGELFSCAMCTGFWVGVFLWAINGFTELFTFDYSLITAFVLGCISSGTSYVLTMMMGDCGFKIDLGGKHETNSKD